MDKQSEMVKELTNVIGDCCDELHVSQVNLLARAILPIIEAREAAAKDELRRLLDAIWKQEYRTEAPDWQPLPDLVGMITQIDNMYAGVRSQRDEARWKLGEAKADAERLADMLRLSARWFEQYALDHEIKAQQAVDSYEQASRADKARRNQERADDIRAALAAWEKQHDR